MFLSQLYQFEVCPFRNVTQREYRPKEWEAIEAAQKSDSHHIPLRDTRPVSVPSSKVGQGVVTHVVQQCVVTQVVPQHRTPMCPTLSWLSLPTHTLIMGAESPLSATRCNLFPTRHLPLPLPR